MKKLGILVCFLFLSGCTTSAQRTPAQAQPHPMDPWTQEALGIGLNPFIVYTNFYLKNSRPENRNEYPAPFAQIECPEAMDMQCRVRYSFDASKRVSCSPTQVGKNLMLVNPDPNNLHFVDEAGYLVGVNCYRKSAKQKIPIDDPRILYGCGVIGKPEVVAPAPNSTLPPANRSTAVEY